MIIYKTTNLKTGKIYIGKDKKNNPDYIGSGQILKSSIKKYGKENFKKEILEECSSLQELSNREKYWIRKLNSTDRKIGYNIADGGLGGDTFSKNPNKEKIRNKMRILSTGKSHSNSTKEKISQLRTGSGNGKYGKPAWNRGIPMSNEQKKKISTTNRGKLLGIPRSEEVKEKISNKLKGKSKSIEHCEKISLKLKGRKLSEITKNKMSLSRKGRNQKKLTCPYCLKIGGTSMHRWHFEKCKFKK